MSAPTADLETNPLRSGTTSNLPRILAHLDISLAVSTYGAGKVVLVRRYGDVINAHFPSFWMPTELGVHQKQTR